MGRHILKIHITDKSLNVDIMPVGFKSNISFLREVGECPDEIHL
jgi:hypothetical protein